MLTHERRAHVGRAWKVGAALAALGLAVLAGSSTAAGRAPSFAAGVVDVHGTLGYEHGTSEGTGIVLDASGIVLTNDHVISGATAIRVTETATRRSYSATVVGYNTVADVAVLQLAGASGLQTVAIGDSATVSVREPVKAVGNARGAGGPPAVTSGTVTALNRSITVGDDDGGLKRLTGLIETTAPLQPGDSGGPLVDGAGRVIGINTAASAWSPIEPGSRQAFAIPINRALRIAKQVRAGTPGPATWIGPTPFLGVGLASALDAEARAVVPGALVAEVVKNSPAERAGLNDGDVITSFDGRAVASADRLTALVLRRRPGATVRIVWVDQYGAEHRTSVRLATGPPH